MFMALLRRSKLPFLFVASQAHNRVSETRLQFAARYLVAVSDQEDDGLVAVGVGYGIDGQPASLCGWSVNTTPQRVESMQMLGIMLLLPTPRPHIVKIFERALSLAVMSNYFYHLNLVSSGGSRQ
jgi:hypothetical protein